MAKNSVASRIRITKNGKIMRRTMGLDHFRAKKNSRQIHRRSLPAKISGVDLSPIRKYSFQLKRVKNYDQS